MTTGPTLDAFQNAQTQLNRACKYYEGENYNESTHKIVENVKRTVEFTVSVQMDDGTRRIFKGFRAQHNNSRGHYK
jgi:glutamate dehydrogenase